MGRKEEGRRRTLVVVEVHLADIFAGTRSYLHVGWRLRAESASEERLRRLNTLKIAGTNVTDPTGTDT